MSVLSLVTDPEFLKLSPEDQRATLSHIDPAFGRLGVSDFNATVKELQKRAISSPGAVAPPGVSRPQPQMETSTLGTMYGAMTQDGTNTGAQPQGNKMPSRFSGADQMAQNIETAAQENEDTNKLSATGIAYGGFKSALGTASDVANLASKVTGNGEFEAPVNDPNWREARGLSQNIGATGETVAEWLAGEGILKGALKLTKLGKIAEASKLLKDWERIVKPAARIAEGATVGAGLGALHNQDDMVEGAEEGAMWGGAGAAAGEVIGAVAPKVIKFVKDAGGVTKAGKQLFSEGAAAEAAQPGVQGAVRNAARDIAEAEGVVPSATKSISNVVENTADSVYGKSKELFSKIDAATGNRFQPIENALKENQKLLRAATSEEEAGKLMAERMSLEARQEKVFNDAVKKGVDRNTVEGARAAYKRSNALYDLDRQINYTYKGSNPNVADAELAKNMPETLNPKQLFERINKLYKSGRLQEALGEAGAKKLYNELGTAVDKGTKAISRAKLNKNIAKYVATITGAGAVGGGVIKHFFL